MHKIINVILTICGLALIYGCAAPKSTSTTTVVPPSGYHITKYPDGSWMECVDGKCYFHQK